MNSGVVWYVSHHSLHRFDLTVPEEIYASLRIDVVLRTGRLDGLPLSPFITTQIRLPTHLSMSSRKISFIRIVWLGEWNSTEW